MHYVPSPAEARRMTAAELRAAFLVQDLFAAGEATIRFFDLDRVALGGVVPTRAPIPLPNPPELAAAFFLERRELGVVNVGGAGSVRVDGAAHRLGNRDGLFVGRGGREVVFASDAPAEPARFYLVSYPAQAAYPTARVAPADAETVALGGQDGANRRVLRRYFHPDGVRTAQLVMGVTDVEAGSVWNTMPAHTHARRTEVYLYFDLPADGFVVHLMGEPAETRHLIVREGEAVLSPGWSIHAGVGTGRYGFCWAMGGENQAFGDMQGVAPDELR
ncbi:MAG TPA: 5-dehydro-4-deoxy-D-glucuronate isomerase [Gemmatimonadales bacterium]|nr:5-dehydro-4-deoxy-D-glucuronate isomerase [Gemmatimonadales bacterium]